MSDVVIQEQLEIINKKLDFILDEIYSQRSRRRSMVDLQEDLIKVADSAIDNITVQLEEVSKYSNIENVIYFAKKLFRNMENLSKMFDKLESMMDFWDASEPLTREIAINVQYKLDELDKKGYFEFLRELKACMDDLLNILSREDIKAIRDIMVAFVEALKETSVNPEEKISVFELMKEMGAPEVRKNVAFFVRLLKNFERRRSLTI